MCIIRFAGLPLQRTHEFPPRQWVGHHSFSGEDNRKGLEHCKLWFNQNKQLIHSNHWWHYISYLFNENPLENCLISLDMSGCAAHGSSKLWGHLLVAHRQRQDFAWGLHSTAAVFIQRHYWVGVSRSTIKNIRM